MKKSFVSPILVKLAKRAGVKIILEPRYGYVGQITLQSGTKRYFKGTNFDINPLAASEIAKDKAYSTYFMKRMGYKVVKGQAFFTSRWCRVIGSSRNKEAAYRYARRIGFPVIVKPNSLSQGAGVTVAYNKRDLMRGISDFGDRDRVFLIQQVVSGNDYRIVVLDGRIISAYERSALSVTGDGRSSIRKLLRKKQSQMTAAGRDTVINMRDPRMRRRLQRFGLSFQSKLSAGKKIELLDNRNLSTGGDARDITSRLHPSVAALAIKLVEDMGLRYCGVDLMIDGTITDKLKNYVVLEINAAPGLDHYASVGKRQQRAVEQMYLQVLRAYSNV